MLILIYIPLLMYSNILLLFVSMLDVFFSISSGLIPCFGTPLLQKDDLGSSWEKQFAVDLAAMSFPESTVYFSTRER